METIAIKTADGQTAEMNIPAPAEDRASVFIFALHKAGSVLLDDIIQDLCNTVRVPTVSIDRFCFDKGLPIERVTPGSVDVLLNSPGYCFSGLRGVYSCLARVDLARHRKVVLVRDPRDILTSFYFSVAKSHAIPSTGPLRETMLASRDAAKETSIDDYVLSQEVRYIRRNFDNFIALEGPTTRIHRYEDVIFNKELWITTLANWLCLDVSKSVIQAIAKARDIRPTDENPSRHIRQVKPGNYKKHLLPSTIQILNKQYIDILTHFNYDI